MVGDTGQDVRQPGLGIDVVEPAGLNQRVGDRRALPASILATKQPRLAPEGDAAQGLFSRIVRQTNPPVGKEPGKCRPASEHLVDGLGQIIVARNPSKLAVQPAMELCYERGAEFLT
jgi:hypothetical protein